MVEIDGPAGNVYDKYSTGNPAARFLMRRFLDTVFGYVDAVKNGIGSAIEVGCGEGNLSSMIASRLTVPFRACDCSGDIIERARCAHRGSGVEFFARSLYDLESGEGADLVIACEVLEHVAEPERALEVLAGLAGKYCILSVPDEPLWRVMNVMRLKYLTSLGNTPGHVNHWSSASFAAAVRRRFNLIEKRTPVPWTVILCGKKP